MMRTLLHALFTLSLFYAVPCYAVEELRYDTNISFTARFNINTYLANEFQTKADDYKIAVIDLNSDGIDEFILKRKICNLEKKLCTHMILAEKDDEILLLSTIRARTLMGGGTTSHGVKDILAFRNEINDYDFEIYMWSPTQKTYILKAEEVRNSE